APSADEQPASAAQSAGAALETRLHVISEPIGAEIRLGGKSIGRAPLTTDLLQPDREYELSASLEGYVSVRRVMMPAAGVTDVTLALPIQPVAGAVTSVARGESPAQPASALLGYLVTNTRPAARVSIDGRETGRWTPVPEANPIALPASACRGPACSRRPPASATRARQTPPATGRSRRRRSSRTVPARCARGRDRARSGPRAGSRAVASWRGCARPSRASFPR